MDYSDLLERYCNKTAGYEILAAMIEPDPDSMNVELHPLSRQEILAKVDANERTIDRRLKQASEVLEILEAKTGVRYDQYNDLRRVYRIVPGIIPPDLLREIKMKGHIRAHQPGVRIDHTNISGGKSDYGPLPGWEEFVNEFYTDRS